MTAIEESDFRLIPVSDNLIFFDVEYLYTVNKGKENERTEFRNIAYGVPLDSAIKRIAGCRVNNKIKDITDLKTYLKEYRDIIKEIKDICCIN